MGWPNGTVYARQVWVFQQHDHRKQGEELIDCLYDEHVGLEGPASSDVDDGQKHVVQDYVGLPRDFLTIISVGLVVRAERPRRQKAKHEHHSIQCWVEAHLEEVLDWDLLSKVKPVLPKDPMIDGVAVVSMRNALKPKLERCLHSHEERKKYAPVRQLIAKSVQEEEEYANELGCHCSTNEFL